MSTEVIAGDFFCGPAAREKSRGMAFFRQYHDLYIEAGPGCPAFPVALNGIVIPFVFSEAGFDNCGKFVCGPV